MKKLSLLVLVCLLAACTAVTPSNVALQNNQGVNFENGNVFTNNMVAIATNPPNANTGQTANSAINEAKINPTGANTAHSTNVYGVTPRNAPNSNNIAINHGRSFSPNPLNPAVAAATRTNNPNTNNNRANYRANSIAGNTANHRVNWANVTQTQVNPTWT